MEVDSGLPIESLLNLGPESGQWLSEVGITWFVAESGHGVEAS